MRCGVMPRSAAPGVVGEIANGRGGGDEFLIAQEHDCRFGVVRFSSAGEIADFFEVVVTGTGEEVSVVFEGGFVGFFHVGNAS